MTLVGEGRRGRERAYSNGVTGAWMMCGVLSRVCVCVRGWATNHAGGMTAVKGVMVHIHKHTRTPDNNNNTETEKKEKYKKK